MKRALFLSVVLVLLAVMGYSGYRLWDINRNTELEARMHSELMQHHPLRQRPQQPISAENLAQTSSEASSDVATEPIIVNQSILDLQAEFLDVVGWLMIPNTRIDYPFVQGPDNDYYLNLDLNKERSPAGTIFMDYRNNSDFSDFNTIIYGHHMRNGSMFGTMQQFNNADFFEANQTGTIFLSDATYEIEFIAFAVIKPTDAVIYNPEIASSAERAAFLEHVMDVARYTREVDITENDRLVTLSTCNYEFNNARMVLIGRIV